MPRWARILIAVAVGGAFLGVVVAWSGVVNVGASTGHWKITEWVLHSAMRQSVETHSLGTEAPPLDDPALARRGAGHYAGACVSCHGAPGVDRAAFALGMVPRPPLLRENVENWEAEELFWIIRHGVKFTGMPAWQALQRTDEVWSMVAFVRRLPDLDEFAYRRFAYGEESGSDDPVGEDGPTSRATERALTGCVRCHGLDGQGSGAFPRLAGQNPNYLYLSLRAYKEGSRFSGMMQSAAAPLDERGLRAVAQHYASRNISRQRTPDDEGAQHNSAGERLARTGDRAAGIPACMTCHGLAAGPRYKFYPVLAGQQPWYLALQLRLFKYGHRGGSAYAHLMHAIAKRLSHKQIAAVADFYGSLPNEYKPSQLAEPVEIPRHADARQGHPMPRLVRDLNSEPSPIHVYHICANEPEPYGCSIGYRKYISPKSNSRK